LGARRAIPIAPSSPATRAIPCARGSNRRSSGQMYRVGLKTGAELVMEKGTVIFVPCTFKRGGFPSERVFVIRPRGQGEYSGVADVGYCYRQDGKPLGDEPPEGQEIQGLVVGIVVSALKDDTIRAHLPDGEVYDLETSNLVPVREVMARHVPV